MTKVKPVQSKLKWNKSSLIETDLYIRVYLAALNSLMTAEDKQTLFMVSKFFTDGAAETGRGNYRVADYNFRRGEAYYEAIDTEKEVLRRMINNVYHRSKSFYHYRQGDFDTAIRLVETTLQNSRILEKQGFGFLVFDRAQQYYNLSRIYFTQRNMEEGLTVLSGSISFLIQGRSKQLPDLNDHVMKEYSADLKRLRYLLLCQMLFDTAEQLMRTEDKETFLKNGKLFYAEVIEAAKGMLILAPEETGLKKWILLLKDFYAGKYTAFKSKATAYLEREPKFYGERPVAILQQYLARA